MRQKAVSQVFIFSLLFLLAGVASAAKGLPDFTKLAKQNSPSVVNISTVHKSSRGARGHLPKGFQIPDLPKDSPFNELFKHFFEDRGRDFGGDREARSLGSGFVVSEDGFILTNYHVVDGADEVQVRFSDRRFYVAKVIGTDKGSDVALLKIDAKNLKPVKIGKSKDLEVGAWVLAIGSPFGFDHTVTAGIVSAKGRSLPSENYVPFIQTDVAINPGNSGGPLFDLNGEVIGINSQIYSRTGGFMGLSFAIPIELAMNVADQLKENGRVSRGFLGILIQDVDRDLADSFGMSQPYGALVARVLPDSPAEDAGLKAGDVILKFDNQRLLNSSQLPPLVGASRVQGTASLLVLRNGREMKKTVKIGALPEDKDEPEAVPAKMEKAPFNDLGFQVADVDRKTRKRLKLDDDDGAMVTEIKQGPARDAGLQPGDVIQMFNGVAVENADHLEQLIDNVDRRSVAILVQRRDGPLFLALRTK